MKKMLLPITALVISQTVSAYPIADQLRHTPKANKEFHRTVKQNNGEFGKFGVNNQTTGQLDIALPAEELYVHGSTNPTLIGTVVPQNQQVLYTLIPDSDIYAIRQNGEIRVHDAVGHVTPVCIFSFESNPNSVTAGYYPNANLINTSNRFHCTFDRSSITSNQDIGNAIIKVENGEETTQNPSYRLSVKNNLTNKKVSLDKTFDDLVAIKPELNQTVITAAHTKSFEIIPDYSRFNSLGGFGESRDVHTLSFLISTEDSNGNKQVICHMSIKDGYDIPNVTSFAEITKVVSSQNQCQLSQVGNKIDLTIQ